MSSTTTIREGSSLYYSLLWIDPSARERFINRLGLINALASTLDDVQEPQVAEKKIHWWHEELHRMHEGGARHPNTQLCESELLGLEKSQAACLDVLSVASSQRFTPDTTIAANNQSLVQSFKARLGLLAHALSNNEVDLDISSHTEEAALAFAYFEQLNRLPSLVHRGLPVFSDELYRQFNVQPQDMAACIRIVAEESAALPSSLKGIPITSEKPAVQPLIDHVIDRSKNALDTAIQHEQTINRYRKDTMLPLWRLLILRQQQLKLWQKKRPNLLQERVTLTPIVKLFYCWRNRR